MSYFKEKDRKMNENYNKVNALKYFIDFKKISFIFYLGLSHGCLTFSDIYSAFKNSLLL